MLELNYTTGLLSVMVKNDLLFVAKYKQSFRILQKIGTDNLVHYWKINERKFKNELFGYKNWTKL